ncbi:MAG: flavin reductase family protein [Burkholderiales bacterium]|nr:flavin reductase family protein [Burkholderiales bacterium]
MSAPTQAAATPAGPADPRALRTALGQFATGVTVVTTVAADRGLVGLTANSFSALSLDPPLVLWSLRETSPSMPAFRGEDRFVVNVLAEAQVEVSRRFATPVPDKFDGIAHALNEHGLPLLHGAAAWFECRTVARHGAGDHVLFIAAVERFTAAEQAPLVFHGGRYFALGSRL